MTEVKNSGERVGKEWGKGELRERIVAEKKRDAKRRSNKGKLWQGRIKSLIMR